MAERSENLVAAAEIGIDRLGLGGGFDNDYVHAIPRLFVIFVQMPGTGRHALPQGKWVNAPRLSNRKRPHGSAEGIANNFKDTKLVTATFVWACQLVSIPRTGSRGLHR